VNATVGRAGGVPTRRVWLALVTAAAVGGCATTHLAQVDPTLFKWPAAVGKSKLPGHAIVVVPEAVAVQTWIPKQEGSGQLPRVQLPIGQIVAAAVVAALAAEFEDGAQWLTTRPAADAGQGTVVEIGAIEAQAGNRLTAWVPVPIPNPLILLGPPLYSSTELTVRVGFDLQRFDGQGQPLGARRCDAGVRLLEVTNWSSEGALPALVRQTHEAAAAGALIGVRDLRNALESERMKPRTL